MRYRHGLEVSRHREITNPVPPSDSSTPPAGAASGRAPEELSQVRSSALSRDGWPLKAAALGAAAVLWVAHLWFSNGAQSAFVDHAVTYGIEQQTRGMRILDMYVAPAANTMGGHAGSASWQLAGALTVTNGTDDRLLRVTIDGAASVIRYPRSGNGVNVTANGVTDIGFSATDPQITVKRADLRPGTFVPVTLTFAHRDDIQVQAPVLPS